MTTRPIQWSHSSLKDFEGCNRRFHEVRVLRKYPRQETDATLYGTEMHAAIENYILEKAEFDPRFDAYRPVVDAMLKKPGRRLPEYQMALRKDLTPCDWRDPDAWVRGVSDLTIVNDDDLSAYVVDWKSGNNKYPDRDQLVLMSLMTFKHFPHLRKVRSALVFLVKGTLVKMQMMYDQTDAFWWKYRERVARLEAAHANNVWPPTQTPLCGWCPVTECPFYKPRKTS